MTEDQKPEEPKNQRPPNWNQKVTKTGTIMTHLMTYAGPNGSEYRLHDAEYQGKHYFDFRKYDSRTRGDMSTPAGVRLNPRLLEFLEDAMMQWRRFHKKITVKEGKLDF